MLGIRNAVLADFYARYEALLRISYITVWFSVIQTNNSDHPYTCSLARKLQLHPSVVRIHIPLTLYTPSPS